MCVEKQAISVVEMARTVGLSRSRFYQLIGTAFPHPIYDMATRRPFYSPELQEACLEVRRRNCGIDGRPVLFYVPRQEVVPVAPKRSKGKAASDESRYRYLVDGLRSLGLAGVTAAQVKRVLDELRLPRGGSTNEGDVVRTVFLHLKGQDFAVLRRRFGSSEAS
jgi:hypothetical protein